MSSTVCRAKNPSNCQYHGSGNSSNTRILRDTMMVARSVYRVASDAEKFEAFYNLQDAEEAYYGTDEGRASLIQHINDSDPNSPNRNHWLQVLDKADKKREFIESQISNLANSDELKVSSLLFNPNMRVEESGGKKYVVLANGSHDDGREYVFDWDQGSGHVIYGEKDDIDSMRILGTAKEVGSAKLICETWYDKVSNK